VGDWVFQGAVGGLVGLLDGQVMVVPLPRLIVAPVLVAVMLMVMSVWVMVVVVVSGPLSLNQSGYWTTIMFQSLAVGSGSMMSVVSGIWSWATAFLAISATASSVGCLGFGGGVTGVM
jgi:hypothetical protein